MGTGPWPQPPTEAEQLQALMATANGESCTVSFTYSIASFSLQMLVFLSVAFVWAGLDSVVHSGSHWRASRLVH